ncbi:ABC transporter substrate-binding protein [Streptomyces sp. NPDC059866]|uniref:ABC transporter substrate-binding protein n=1 Tax=Streptomyces sp. NPDC059866 TaxID=3346978 RepID=UPI00364F3B5E
MACGSGTNGKDPAKADASGAYELTFGCAPAVSGLPRWIGEEIGLDKELGLKIRCSSIASGPEVTAALVSEEISTTQLVPANVVPLLDKGQGLVAYAGFNRIELFQPLVRSGYDLPHKSEGWKGVMKDLDGAKIGVVARGRAAEFLTRALFDRPAWMPTSRPTSRRSSPATLAALSSGQIDMALVTEPTSTQALHDGTAVQPFLIGEDSGPPQMKWGSTILVSSRAYAEKNKEPLCRFKKLYRQGIDYIRDPANRDKVLEVLIRETKMDEEVAERALDRAIATYPETVDVDPELWDPVFAFYLLSCAVLRPSGRRWSASHDCSDLHCYANVPSVMGCCRWSPVVC